MSEIEAAPTTITQEQRTALLEAQTARMAAEGWRVESQGVTQLIVSKGKKTNHLLHLALSVFTLSFWIPVWIVVGFVNRKNRERRIIAVDQAGNMQVTDAKW